MMTIAIPDRILGIIIIIFGNKVGVVVRILYTITGIRTGMSLGICTGIQAGIITSISRGISASMSAM